MFKKKKKKEEKIYREISSEKEPKSRARRVRMLLKKNEAVFRDKQKLTDFKEPVLQLIRRSGSVEFYEDASKGSFVFKHSDGRDREIYLDPSGQLTFDYGKRKFKGYICQEDTPLPLPENPRVSVDTINSVVEKVGLDMKKLSLRGKELQIKTLKVLLWFVLGAALLFILYKIGAFQQIINLVTGSHPAPIVDTGGGSAVDIIQNSSLNVAASGG